MLPRREQELSFAVSSVSEPVFCPSTAVPFASQVSHLFSRYEEGARTTVAAASTGDSGVDEAMTDFSPSTPFTASAQPRDCFASATDGIHDGFHFSDGHADLTRLQHMSLLTTQLRTRQAQHPIAQQVTSYRNRDAWAQVIDGEARTDDDVPRVTWRRTDEAARMRQFMAECNLTRTPESSPPRNGLGHGYWTVDSDHRFFDVVDFVYNWADSTDDAWVCDIAEKFLALNPERDVWYGEHTDMQGMAWTTDEAFTRKDVVDARRRHYFRPACNYRNTPVEDAQMYSFKSFRARHRAQCVHYQLRHLVTATSRGEVFYAAGTKVKAANLSVPSICSTVLDFERPASSALPFRVTALASSDTNDAMLIAGGFNGEYAILNLAGGHAVEGVVSRAYDGLVTHIDASQHHRTGAVQAAFSTNDCHIRVKDLTTMGTIGSYQYNHAINATQLSADGRLRVVVGDHHDSLITDAETGKPLAYLGGQAKDCFSCAWSEDGRSVATGAQDGYTTLWDARNWSEPLDIVRRTNSCARSLHFTSDNRLVLAEDDDIVSIYDVYTRQRQDIVMFGSIAGVALLNGGEEIVVANIDATTGGLLVLGRENASSSWASQLVI